MSPAFITRARPCLLHATHQLVGAVTVSNSLKHRLLHTVQISVDRQVPDISEPLRNLVVKRTILASALAWFCLGNSSRRSLREIQAELDSAAAGFCGPDLDLPSSGIQHRLGDGLSDHVSSHHRKRGRLLRFFRDCRQACSRVWSALFALA
jgi:hypothetical protein